MHYSCHVDVHAYLILVLHGSLSGIACGSVTREPLNEKEVLPLMQVFQLIRVGKVMFYECLTLIESCSRRTRAFISIELFGKDSYISFGSSRILICLFTKQNYMHKFGANYLEG